MRPPDDTRDRAESSIAEAKELGDRADRRLLDCAARAERQGLDAYKYRLRVEARLEERQAFPNSVAWLRSSLPASFRRPPRGTGEGGAAREAPPLDGGRLGRMEDGTTSPEQTELSLVDRAEALLQLADLQADPWTRMTLQRGYGIVGELAGSAGPVVEVLS